MYHVQAGLDFNVVSGNCPRYWCIQTCLIQWYVSLPGPMLGSTLTDALCSGQVVSSMPTGVAAVECEGAYVSYYSFLTSVTVEDKKRNKIAICFAILNSLSRSINTSNIPSWNHGGLVG